VRSTRRLVFTTALAGLCALAALLLAAASALALPPGRHYEMVSPVFTGGYGASRIEAVAPDGEGVAYYSQGVFAGAPRSAVGENAEGGVGYLARRTSSGWSTVGLTTPLSLAPSSYGADLSPALGTVLRWGSPGANSENTLLQQDLLLHSTASPDTVAGWEVLDSFAMQPPEYEGATADFCHIFFASVEPLLPEATGLYRPLYEFARGCGGEPAALRLVGLNNKGKPVHRECVAELGTGLVVLW
jgi:hypothetical protein